MLAQMQAASPEQVSTWLMGACGFLGVVVLILTGLNQFKQWMAKPARPVKQRRPLGERFITRAEHEGTAKTASDALGKLESYTRDRTHELNNTVHQIQLRVTEQRVEVGHMIEQRINPLIGKIEKIDRVVVAIGVKVGVPIDGIESV